MVINLLKVIQGHRFWYQSKAHVSLPISNVDPVLHHFQVIAGVPV